MYLDLILESEIPILDDMVDDIVDAEESLMYDVGFAESIDQLIPDSVVDAENDDTDYDKYSDEDYDY